MIIIVAVTEINQINLLPLEFYRFTPCVIEIHKFAYEEVYFSHHDAISYCH